MEGHERQLPCCSRSEKQEHGNVQRDRRIFGATFISARGIMKIHNILLMTILVDIGELRFP